MKKILTKCIQILNIIFVLLTLGLVLISLFKKEWITLALEWIEGVVAILGTWNYLVIFAVSLIESFPFLGVIVPGMNVMILVGGFFAGTSTQTFILSCLIAIVGACLGNATGFLFGKVTGRDFLKKYGYWFGIGATERKYLEKVMQTRGFWFIVGAKFHNTLRAFIPYIAGASKMKTRKFWTYNMIGSMIWAISILSLGVVFIDNYETILKYFNWIFIVIVVGAIVYVAKFHRSKLNTYLQEKNKEIEAMQKK